MKENEHKRELEETAVLQAPKWADLYTILKREEKDDCQKGGSNQSERGNTRRARGGLRLERGWNVQDCLLQ